MDYQQQGFDFLTKNKINIKVKFLKYATHFIGEKESRDIFKITFIRYGKQFSITFGQSIADSTGNGDNRPSPYDILTCVTKNDSGSFESFCSDFGYDTDSISALKIYKNVQKEWEKVSNFFTEQEIEELQEIN